MVVGKREGSREGISVGITEGSWVCGEVGVAVGTKVVGMEVEGN